MFVVKCLNWSFTKYVNEIVQLVLIRLSCSSYVFSFFPRIPSSQAIYFMWFFSTIQYCTWCFVLHFRKPKLIWLFVVFRFTTVILLWSAFVLKYFFLSRHFSCWWQHPIYPLSFFSWKNPKHSKLSDHHRYIHWNVQGQFHKSNFLNLISGSYTVEICNR